MKNYCVLKTEKIVSIFIYAPFGLPKLKVLALLSLELEIEASNHFLT